MNHEHGTTRKQANYAFAKKNSKQREEIIFLGYHLYVIQKKSFF